MAGLAMGNRFTPAPRVQSHLARRKAWDAGLERLPLEDPEDGAGRRALSMASLNRQGRWGNAVFQYSFAKLFAEANDLPLEVPDWLGPHLFGHRDPPITRRHPVVLLDCASRIADPGNHWLFTHRWAHSRAETLARADGRRALFWDEASLESGDRLPFASADLEGLYVLHAARLAPRKERFRQLFAPVAPLERAMQAALSPLRTAGRTLVGVHVRRGDFEQGMVRQGFDWLAPVQWYVDWLRSVWRDLHAPSLLVCTDSPETVLPRFAEFEPFTSSMLGAALPGSIARVSAPGADSPTPEFFPDWYLLSQCDLLAVSNSTFSASAAMLAGRARVCVRPDPDARRLVPFDPWDSEPLLFLRRSRWVPDVVAQRLRLGYEALGAAGALSVTKVLWKGYRSLIRDKARTLRRFHGVRVLARAAIDPRFYLTLATYTPRAISRPAAPAPSLAAARRARPPVSARA